MILGKVENQKLTISHDLIASDTIDYLTAKFELSPEWAGRSVTSVFSKGEKSYAIQLVNGEITADKHLNLSEGVWEVNLYGTDTQGTRITTNPADISVKRTGNMEGTEPGAVPPSIAEQLDARITKLENDEGGDVTKEYVDRQDDEMLMDAMEYTDNQIKLVPTPDVDKAYVDKQDKATISAVDSKLIGYLKTGDISEWAKQPKKPTYTASEVGALPDSTEIPNVPKWAMEPQKPLYTAKEVGALPDDTIVPSKTSELQNDSGFLTEHQSLAGYATETYVNDKVSEIKVPTKISELADDAEHRTVTDTEKEKWNAGGGSNPTVYQCDTEPNEMAKIATPIIGSGDPKNGDVATVIFSKGNTELFFVLIIGEKQYSVAGPDGNPPSSEIPAGFHADVQFLDGEQVQMAVILNLPAGTPALTITDYVPTYPKYVYDEGKLYLKNDRIYYAAKIVGGTPVKAGKLETAVQSGASIATEGSRYVYIFGGMTGSGLDSLTDGIWKYDTQEKVTTKLAAVLPTPRCSMAAAALDGKIYLFGGSTGYDIDTGKVNLHTTPEILVFDTATEQISAFSKAFEFGISGGYAGAYNGKLYYMGGKGKSAEAVYEIDPVAGTMTAVLVGISTATAFGSYAMVGDTLYTFGGKPFNPYSQSSYEKDPPTNLIYAFKLGAENDYSTVPQYFPEGFMESVACAVGTDIYILGGVKKNPDGGWLNVYDGKLWKFDTLTNSLTEQEYVQNPALAGNMMAKDGNLEKVYIMGGYHNAVGGGMKDGVSVMSFEPTFEMKELATMGDVPNYGTWTGGDF